MTSLIIQMTAHFTIKTTKKSYAKYKMNLLSLYQSVFKVIFSFAKWWSNHQTAKWVKVCIDFNYRDQLFKIQNDIATFSALQHGSTVNKTTLSPFKTQKRCITPDSITAYAYASGCSQYMYKQFLSNKTPLWSWCFQIINTYALGYNVKLNRVYINIPYYWICCPSFTTTFLFSGLIQISHINLQMDILEGFFFVSAFNALITTGNLFTHLNGIFCGFFSCFAYYTNIFYIF